MSFSAFNPREIEKQLAPFFETDNLIGLRFYHPSQDASKTTNGEDGFIFADNEMSYLYVSSDTGKLWLTDFDEQMQFVNSAFERFMSCLNEHRKLLDFAGDDDSQYYQAGQKLEKFIAEIDPEAIEDNNFWALITDCQKCLPDKRAFLS